MIILSDEITFEEKSIFEVCHPVGSIFQTTDSTVDPKRLCKGNTTWELIKGKFLLSVDPEKEEYSKSCSVGGEEKHTLTVSEMPAHEHKINKSDGAELASWQTNASKGSLWWMPADGAAGTNLQYKASPTGGGEEHNNMPPYYTVYTWHRVA